MGPQQGRAAAEDKRETKQGTREDRGTGQEKAAAGEREGDSAGDEMMRSRGQDDVQQG